MFNKNIERREIPIYGIIDERTRAVVYQGDAYTGRFMLFAVLIDVVIRGLNLIAPLTRSNWDLMLIVLVGSIISTVFQIKNKVVSNRRGDFLYVILFVILCAAIAYLVTVLCLKSL